MPKPQFSIRVLLFVTFLVAVTAWLARQLAPLTGQDDLGTQVIVGIVAFAIGPAGFSILGYLAGRDANTPWRGAIGCFLVGLIGWLLFLYWPL